FLQVATGVPIRGAFRLVDQRLKTLLRGRVLLVVELVEIEGVGNTTHVGLGKIHLGLVALANYVGDNKRGQQTENGDDHHDLEQRETLLAPYGANLAHYFLPIE